MSQAILLASNAVAKYQPMASTSEGGTSGGEWASFEMLVGRYLFALLDEAARASRQKMHTIRWSHGGNAARGWPGLAVELPNGQILAIVSRDLAEIADASPDRLDDKFLDLRGDKLLPRLQPVVDLDEQSTPRDGQSRRTRSDSGEARGDAAILRLKREILPDGRVEETLLQYALIEAKSGKCTEGGLIAGNAHERLAAQMLDVAHKVSDWDNFEHVIVFNNAFAVAHNSPLVRFSRAVEVCAMRDETHGYSARLLTDADVMAEYAQAVVRAALEDRPFERPGFPNVVAQSIPQPQAPFTVAQGEYRASTERSRRRPKQR